MTLDGCRKRGALADMDFDGMGRLVTAVQIMRGTMRLDEKFVPVPEPESPNVEDNPVTLETEDKPAEAEEAE